MIHYDAWKPGWDPGRRFVQGFLMICRRSPAFARGCGALFALVLFLAAGARPVSAQIVEAVGSRALGMGGAFVAVANDSSATWWNPGALAVGPYIDVSVARAVTESSEAVPASRDRVSWFALAMPPIGVGYYRLRVTGVEPLLSSTGSGDAGREEGQGRVPVRTLDSHNVGATLVHSLTDGVHVGATLRYVHGMVKVGVGDLTLSPSDLLEWGASLEGGVPGSDFDLDVGVLAVFGAIRVGGLARNVLEAEFDAPIGSPIRLQRQVRVGGAFDGDAIDLLPLTVSLDADVRRYDTAAGDRRVIAVGAEQWLFTGRVAVRGGGRFNTVGAEERAATVGGTVKVRSGLFVDGHVVGGGSADDRGWGIAARVSF